MNRNFRILTGCNHRLQTEPLPWLIGRQNMEGALRVAQIIAKRNSLTIDETKLRAEIEVRLDKQKDEGSRYLYTFKCAAISTYTLVTPARTIHNPNLQKFTIAQTITIGYSTVQRRLK